MHSEYQARINKVIAYIDANLSGDLSLEQLARVACFSEYHFHRLFRSLIGENLNEFIQRRRLETAARALYLNPKDKVIDVALNAGYDNPTSFFRAFRQYFGSSPSAWRKKAAKEWAESQLSRKNSLRAQNSKIGNVLDPATWQILQGTSKAQTSSGRVEIRDLPECRIQRRGKFYREQVRRKRPQVGSKSVICPNVGLFIADMWVVMEIQRSLRCGANFSIGHMPTVY